MPLTDAVRQFDASPPELLQKGAWESALAQLTAWLVGHRELWQARPFTKLPVSWEGDYRELAGALRALTPDQVEGLEARGDEQALLPQPFGSWADQATLWRQWPWWRGQSEVRLRQPVGVPERKWYQLAAFLHVVLAVHRPTVGRWLDWCSGKGHLGRLLAQQTGLPLSCVDRDAALCAQGAELADGAGVSARFLPADVLCDSLVHELSHGLPVGVVALHACGRLHRRLLNQLCQSQAAFMALAPCCYHRGEGDSYEPLSAYARRLTLRPTGRQLRLVGLAEVVASARRRQQRQREQAYRLGLAELLRREMGQADYVSLGPAPRRWWHHDFRRFCHSLAKRASLEVPQLGSTAYDDYEQFGWERLTTVRALGLVRGLFRGPLETWLLLDRAQFLVERGWQVQVKLFCEAEVTPRNALILAWR